VRDSKQSCQKSTLAFNGGMKLRKPSNFGGKTESSSYLSFCLSASTAAAAYIFTAPNYN
jgi:hypothetical protein